MSIRALAAEDDKDILAMDGDEVTITSPSGTTYATTGHYIRRGVDTDPGTGLPIAGDVSAFTVSLQALVSLGLTDVNSLKKSGWTVSSTDVLGVSVTGRITDVMLDRTIGRVTFLAKV